MTLLDLQSRTAGRIVDIDGPEPLRRRLAALGILRGQPVKLSASTPWGNPRAYYVGRQQICLRNEDAGHIRVELCDD